MTNDIDALFAAIREARQVYRAASLDVTRSVVATGPDNGIDPELSKLQQSASKRLILLEKTLNIVIDDELPVLQAKMIAHEVLNTPSDEEPLRMTQLIAPATLAALIAQQNKWLASKFAKAMASK
jgi:hypothetical protein